MRPSSGGARISTSGIELAKCSTNGRPVVKTRSVRTSIDGAIVYSGTETAILRCKCSSRSRPSIGLQAAIEHGGRRDVVERQISLQVQRSHFGQRMADAHHANNVGGQKRRKAQMLR